MFAVSSWWACFVLSSYVLMVPILPDNAVAQTTQAIAKKGVGATVLLVMQNNRGRDVSLGTGFFVRDGEVATNAHVVEGATQGYARFANNPSKFQIAGITGMDLDNDLVVLKIPSMSATRPLILGNSNDVQVGDTVYAIGNPKGLEATFSTGVISAVRELRTGKVLQITAPISSGSSGGPVLNQKGDVIGVAFATFQGGQNLNFAIPSNYLQVLLMGTTPLRSLATVTSSLKQRTIIADLTRPGVKDRVIKDGVLVAIQYKLTETDGRLIESNIGKEALRYIHGQKKMIPGLEKALTGMKIGDEKHVIVRPEDAYGPIKPNAVEEIPKEKIPASALRVGAVLSARSPTGTVVPMTVRQIKENTVLVDLNHPMAGKTLVFDIKVLDIDPPQSSQSESPK